MEQIDKAKERKPFFTGYRPQFYFKKSACTCALNYQAIKCPVHTKNPIQGEAK